jgi:hypothetical protein
MISTRYLKLLCAVLVATPAIAQDQNYNSYNYGTRSALMGGAVVGGVRDTTASFYNPGALGFIDNPSLSVSANALRYEQTTIDNGAGTGDDLDSDELNVVPLIISGIYKPEDKSPHSIGYTILTRQDHQLNFSDRRDVFSDVINNQFFPGLENYIGQYRSQTELTEYWGGLAYSYKLNDNLSVGFTNFLALRNQKNDSQVYARAIGTSLAFNGSTDVSSLYDYDHLRALWKFGLAGDYESVKFGITATTPSVDIWGDGVSARNITLTNLDLNRDGVPDSLVADDRQDGLDAEYRSPLSL